VHTTFFVVEIKLNFCCRPRTKLEGPWRCAKRCSWYKVRSVWFWCGWSWWYI